MAIKQSIGVVAKFYCYLVCIMMLIDANSVAQNTIVNADTLIKMADVAFNKNPNLGIAAAKTALNYSLKENSVAHEIKCLNMLAGFFWMAKNYNMANEYANKGVLVSRNATIDSLTGDALVISGVIKQSQQQYQAAISRYQQASSYYNKKNLFGRLAVLYLNLGLCESAIARFEIANYYYFKAADLFVALRNKTNTAKIFSYIGNCYAELKDYKKAITYNKKSLQVQLGSDDQLSVAETYNNLGYAFKQSGRPDSALFYLSRSLKIRQQSKDSSLLVHTLQNMGSAMKMKGDFKTAESLIRRSLKIAANYHMQAETASGYLDMAELYLAQRNYAAALRSANITQNTAAALKRPEDLMNAYALKARLFAQTGDDKQAFLYTGKSDLIKDSIFTATKNATIAELDIKYETARKEHDIAALNLNNGLQKKVVKQQTTLIIILVIAAALMFVLLAVAYHNFRQKNLANIKIQLLLRDTHHRVKNNLQILSGLFAMQINELNDEKTKNTLRENETRLTSMNLIHNQLYLDDTSTKIEMHDYLTKLLHHIQASFGGHHITLNIRVEPIEIEADRAIAIGLIVSELVTNAFKYAFNSRADGTITLLLKYTGKTKLLLVLADNGKGTSGDAKESGASFGLKLVNLMARQLNTAITVSDKNGTSYEMEISV